MNLGAQIKKYRAELSLSQDELAEKLFVTRQSISNWENDKTYPDIKSLVLLSEVFGVSLDQLVKGDVEIMKKEIDVQEKAKFQQEGVVLVVFFIAILLLPMPLAKFWGWYGLAVYVVVAIVGICYAVKVEQHKKQLDIQTYKEIVAFTEGKSLSEIEKARESGKRVYQKILLGIGSGILALIVCGLMAWILG
ncbi:MAG: helix-turn-helix transcriptional regulator [Lachnospiraceae bacterium]|nr:helix-turn-helix transcriptional regulator [Lachnospiraceae bacterium]